MKRLENAESLTPQQLRSALKDKLREEGRADLVSRLNKCGNPLRLRCADCHLLRDVFTRCDLKWCPSCQRAIAARNAARYAKIAAAAQWPLFVTFTCQHSITDSVDLLRTVRRSHTKLRRLRWWKSAVKGGVVSYEVTNTNGNGWHPHGHALIDCRWLSVRESSPAVGATREQWKAKGRRATAEVAQQWSLCLGRRGTVHVRRVYSGEDGGIGAAVAEVLKYSVKGTDLVKVDSPIGPLIDTLDRTRLLCSWGSFYRHSAVKRERCAPSMCQCGSCSWLPEEVLDKRLRNELSRR